MKKLLLAGAATALLAGVASAEEVKVAVILDFTGPLESFMPDIAAGAEFAIKEVSDSGIFLGGSTVTSLRGDSTCVDAGAAVAAAETLMADGVKGIIGAGCSGASTAILQNVSIPNGMVQISPASTSPGLTNTDDNGLFFRTAPSDVQQAVIMAQVLFEDGVKSAAVSYMNSDYGKGLSDQFAKSFVELGGTITINQAHEVGKADYSADIASLAAAGGEVLVIAGYIDQGGGDVLQAALDTGAFDTFLFPDGMMGQALKDRFGDMVDGSYGTAPGTDNAAFVEMTGLSGVYSDSGYDAAALMLLAMQAANSSDGSVYKDKIMDIANAPGEQIKAGELAKGLEILAAGGDIDYVGASSVEFTPVGEPAGGYRVVRYENGDEVTTGYR